MTARTEIRYSQLADIVGAANLISDPVDLAGYEVDGLSPSAAVRVGTPEEVTEVVHLAATEKLAVIPVGARTKLRIGMPPERYDLAIDLSRLDKVLAYDPGDLTLSVQAGIPAGRVLNLLAEHKQFLPLAVPFVDRATVGGTLASGVDTPLRHFYGMPRDYVLGMQFVTGKGTLTKSGGRVVKNVTGYDLHKLMLGAIGTLGIITAVNFKTFPQPSHTQTWAADFGQAEAAFAMAAWVMRSALTPYALDLTGGWSPLPVQPGVLEMSDRVSWQVAISGAGDAAVLDRYSRELRNAAETSLARSFVAVEESEEQAHWQQICEFQGAVLAESREATIIRAGVVPAHLHAFVKHTEQIAAEKSVRVLFLARALGVVYVVLLPARSAGSKLGNLAEACRAILKAAGAIGGYATIQWCPRELKASVNVWGDEREDAPLMRKLKSVFDPERILAPGRFLVGM